MGPGFPSQDVDLESLFCVTARPPQRDGNAATHELALSAPTIIFYLLVIGDSSFRAALLIQAFNENSSSVASLITLIYTQTITCLRTMCP